MADSNTLSAQRAKGYLRDLGWTNNQAAGLVGNFQQESGVNLNPSIVSPDGTSYGIAQWTAPRQNIFKQTYGKPIQGTSLKEQLDFVHYELNNNEKAAGDALRATTTPSQAALVVSNQYERPNAAFANNGQRVAYANTSAETPVVLANNDTLSQSEQDKLNNQSPSEPGDTVAQKTKIESSEPVFGPNARYYDFSKMTPEEIAATGTLGGINKSGTTISSKPIPNRLKEYPSYIYGLSLHILSDTEYNRVVEQQTYTPANVLISSAGRYSSTFPRNEFFNEDFYFDDCSILTVIAPNDVSRNTNAIDVSFTIIEPYGFTLVERLLQVSDALKSKNYLDMPYLLQIDFFALDDSGNIVGSINDLKKRIPIKINTMDMRVSTKGTEYKITASPFNHTAYDSTSVTTPANFEITASTVAEFFQSAADAEQFSQILSAQNSATQRETADKNATKPATNTNANRLSTANFAAGAIPTPPRNQNKTTPPSKKVYTTVKSYGSAVNDWYRALKESRKISHNDVYKFVFLPDPDTGEDMIGSAAFIQKNLNTPKDSPMKSNRDIGDQVNMRRSDLGDSKTGIHDISKAIFQVQYGTTIEKLLEYIIRNSDYIQRQLIVPEDPDYDRQKEAFKDKPLSWFKIVPIIRLLNFDDIKKVWSREITYTVQPYKIYNVRLDVGPQGVMLYPVKNYEYIYTGHNDDVFDFDINFNFLYYNQVTAYRDSMSDLNPSASSYTTDYQTQNAPNYGGGEPPKGLNYNSVTPMVLKPVVQNSKAQATGGATTAREVAGVDLNESIMTNSQADLLVINLKILGDPDFIKQDDVFYRPILPEELPNIATKPSSDARLLPNNGSLVMDGGGIYAQLLFRTPTDIDENTGLMKFNPDYKHSVFSGLYSVIQVTSHFSNGQFSQELVMTRLPRQSAFDYVNNNQNNKSTNRDENSQQKQPGLSPPDPVPTPSTVVSGGAEPNSPADQADTDTDQTAGKDQKVSQISNADPRVETSTQSDLRNVKDTAVTETINSSNQPQTNTPAPAGGTRLADGSVLYNGPATPQNSIRGVSADGQQLPVGVSQNVASGVYQYKGVNLPGAADDPAVMNKFVSAINSGSTTVYSYEDPVSGKTITRTFNGAKGTSN